MKDKRITIHIDGASVHVGRALRRDRYIHSRRHNRKPPWIVIELMAKDLNRAETIVKDTLLHSVWKQNNNPKGFHGGVSCTLLLYFNRLCIFYFHMNREKYFNSVESKLSLLATRIEVRGSLNILDLNLHSENFYLDFFNVLFDWNLKNLNAVQHNSAGIDLVDTTNNIVIQVSSTATKQKIESALAKDLSAYSGYSFKFISISKDANNLRSKTFSNPHKLKFSPKDDIFDIPKLLSNFSVMNIYQQKKIHEFLVKELKSEPDPEKIESNLTTIIIILSKENLSQGCSGFETAPYDIEAKISYNKLNTARVLIDDYKIHYRRIDKIYTEFDRQGANKSLSILDTIRAEYVILGTVDYPDQCFFTIIEKVAQIIRASANYTNMPDEELMLCVRILVVDAFIRCKIFKNPIEDTNAHS